jgi:diphosphomevalonate decarboxylase
MKATAIAHPNIAVVKYWGKRCRALNLPAVPSLSVTLDSFHTTTTVEWGAARDGFELNGRTREGREAKRVFEFLDRLDPDRPPCRVLSENNFPTAAGLASSASAFAALAMAGASASGREMEKEELSVLARQGSGSACRSLWGGWVHWKMGKNADGSDSHGQPIAPREHWDLRVVVAVVSHEAKSVGSTEGMIRSQRTSPFYGGWIGTYEADIQQGRAAIENRELRALGEAMERSTLKMHAVMLSSTPAIRYWRPGSVAILDCVDRLRAEGIPCYQTMDAGPNVKILCSAGHADRVAAAVEAHAESLHILGIGDDARLV